jgi:hypothetical protein
MLKERLTPITLFFMLSMQKQARSSFESDRAIDDWAHFIGLALANGRIYAVDHSSQVYCLGLKESETKLRRRAGVAIPGIEWRSEGATPFTVRAPFGLQAVATRYLALAGELFPLGSSSLTVMSSAWLRCATVPTNHSAEDRTSG